MSQRNYLSAIETLNNYQTSKQSQPVYNKIQAMTRYLTKCGMPLQKLDNLPVIHVTGTHGKGSTCCYCESILRNHGYKTGFYSSPHLLEVRERIRIGGKPISKDTFSDNFWEVYDMLDKQKENQDDMPLYFPLLTIIAFHIFLKSNIDVAIIEVGIGGEFDCTNVIRNPVAVGITPICLDHTAQLGTTELSIAWHKGGIMKRDSVAFTVPQKESVLKVLFERSAERNCPLTPLRKKQCAVDGRSKVPAHMRETAVDLAMTLCEAYVKKRSGIFSREMAIRSVENARWPGRYDVRQIHNMRFLLDGAHTPSSVKTTAEWYTEQTKNSCDKKVLVFNLTGKRDPEPFLKELTICGFDKVIFIPNVGMEKETADTANLKQPTDTQIVLCEKFRAKWLELQGGCGECTQIVEVFSSFSEALRFLGNAERYEVLVTGSLYLVGAVLSVLDPTLGGDLIDDE